MFPTWEVMQEYSKQVRDQMIKESIESAHSNAMTYGAMLKETDTISKDEIATPSPTMCLLSQQQSTSSRNHVAKKNNTSSRRRTTRGESASTFAR